MNIKHEIADLVEAIQAQCGLMASFHNLRLPNGNQQTTVQVCLKPDVLDPGDNDWRFFHASSEAGLLTMRDEVAAFIAENRKEVAA